jgi:hypothetical protein
MKIGIKKTSIYSYRGLAHQSTPAEITDMKEFINQQLPHA